MNSTLLDTGWSMWIMLALVVLATAVITQRFLALPARRILSASARALVQLVLIALLISHVSTSWILTGSLLVLMFGVAVITSTQRVDSVRWWVPACVMFGGVLPVVALMFGFGVLPTTPLAVIAVVGQLIGGAMSATNLAGRRIEQELQQRAGEVEAAMALGFPDATARNLIARPVASEALLPGLDQTRTVGTVTLPGAFVGLVLGGASPVDAGLVQLVVLINLTAVQAISVSLLATFMEHQRGIRRLVR